MGILSNVVRILDDAQIRTERAYSGTNWVEITDVVAAVQLQAMDDTSASVLVNVMSPAEFGAATCENAAIRIRQILQEEGASCKVGEIAYFANVETFCSPITAKFTGVEKDDIWVSVNNSQTYAFSVTMGGVRRNYAVSFTARRATDTSVTDIASAVWEFTLEELFPLDTTEEAAPSGTFTIITARPGRTETYTSCVLTEQKRILTEEGLRHIRSGTAGGMTAS